MIQAHLWKKNRKIQTESEQKWIPGLNSWRIAQSDSSQDQSQSRIYVTTGYICVKFQCSLIYPGFPPYLENLEFCHFLQAWNLLKKVVKTWTFNTKPGKNLKFAKSKFEASLFQKWFTKIILIYFFVISTLSTQTLVWSEIDLGFHCFCLEIHGKYMEFCVTREVGTLHLL